MALEDVLKEQLGDNPELLQSVMTAAEEEANALVNVKTEGLSKKRDQLLAEVKALKKNQLPEDVDIEAYQNYLSEKEQFEAEKLKAEETKLAEAGRWDELKNSMVNSHRDEVSKLQNDYTNQINELKLALDKELIENVAIKAIDKEEGNAMLLLPHIKPHLMTQRNDETGNYETVVVDGSGNPRINEKDGNPFTVSDLIAEFKANEIYSGAFPMQNGGSNIPAGKNGKGSAGQQNPWKRETWNVTNQARLLKENPTLGQQMKKAAGR